MWVIAGPNGAGKSTLSDRYFAGKVPVVNPDNIAAKNPLLGAIGAGKQSIAEQKNLMVQGKSFAWETTMSGNRELALMRAAKAAGYKVNLVYIGIRDSKASMMRVQGRVDAGGHNVPQSDIARRFDRSLKNLPEALKIADRAYVLDNSGERRRLVLVRELDQTRKAAKDMPRWLVDALPTAMYRAKGLER